ncbi:pseudo ring cleavage dioxygenase [Schizosaccharomyces cryophilus OY26]|uniref:Pseudo ring cleavage dioxygenase n=1 Tax=Schizosaccharomyces cryophilus (strain OY26 / ATCC MYA-4695 / CBS 11777 / NBRC 106824 / NRRL Y48691) TaxID=653667 RepID=S9VZ65_SCHCR|nr:pseudo ring cleavage dioxygenase [Schizosaccharomyces cryophilus OY26]EPY51105.1 pseudo ring cleavage dioxygenase [Schizosaccharomyces cryophilus OY26]
MIDRVDHFVLTVRNLERSRDFYVRGLGMGLESFGNGRTALTFGNQKINLHIAEGSPILPRASFPTPGSADICFICSISLQNVIEILRERNLPIELGPVERTGAKGRIESIYLRDPDMNLIELSEYK